MTLSDMMVRVPIQGCGNALDGNGPVCFRAVFCYALLASWEGLHVMETSEILFDVRNRVATLTFNRPERMNAWSPSLEAALRECIAVAVADDQVRAIMLIGAGRGFCVGAQMNKLAENADGGATTAASARSGNLGQRYSYLLDVPKPIIAAINGPVAGVGLCIALYCDLRYMVAGSKLSTSFARRGLVAEHGSAWMLSRLVGPMNASDLLLSARSVLAEEAERMGLVRVLPPDHFGTAVHAIASDLANLSSPRSMAIIKRQLALQYFQSLEEATQLADAEIAKCRGTADYKEGVAHFVEKRPPQFTGL
jgi:enoyl-CoA hydratase/carnithine racemase